MNSLFGLSMTAIMITLAALFAACLGAVVAIALTNGLMFRMGLRNVRRRRTQTGLIVVGLMLATLIITAAFITGDSLNYSITRVTYDNLQRTDLSLHHFRGADPGQTSGLEEHVDARIVPALQAAFQNDPDIDGFMPALFETLPALNPRTQLAEPVATFSGVDGAALSRYGGLLLKDGGKADAAALKAGRVFVDQKAADKLDIRAGDVITTYAQGVPRQFPVAGIVKNTRTSGDLNFGPITPIPGIAIDLATLQQITGHDGQLNDIDVALRGDVRSSLKHTDAAVAKLERLSASDQGGITLGMGNLSFKVEKNKRDAVDAADLVGSLFTTTFLLLGLFSIAADIILIFTIFVMLAAERKTAMGIARAVGASRANLVQTFVAEGMAYDLLAGVVGAALGVAAAVWLIVGGTKLIAGEQFAILTAHVTLRSLIVSYTLGAALTFATVVLSALRISRLNIVAAIRGSEERARRRARPKTRWAWVVAGIPALLVLPLGLYWILRKGFGLAWGWVFGPTAIGTGILLVIVGKASEQLFPFTAGMSLLPLGAALIAPQFRAPSRITWTAVGVYLGVYWLLPFDLQKRLFGNFPAGGAEMYVLSGMMVVLAFTLVIVFNARLLDRLVKVGSGAGVRAYRLPIALALAAVLVATAAILIASGLGGLGQLLYLLVALLLAAAALAFAAVRYPALAPAVKMGVAYPLANRFRTGMTIAMFALIVFSLTEMSVINASFLKLFSTSDARGSWDIAVGADQNNPTPDITAALQQAQSPVATQITASSRLTPQQWYGAQEVRQPNRGQSWVKYDVRAGDSSFFDLNAAKLEYRAQGYSSDRAVYAAIKTQANLAVLDYTPFSSGNLVSAGQWTIQGVKIKNAAFAPFAIEIRDPITGKSESVTVIGVLSAKIPTGLFPGVLVNEQSYAAVYGPPTFRNFVLRLTPGVDGDRAAKAIKAALVTRGVQAFSLKKLIDDGSAQSRGIMRVFQAFMGLGLFVGLAGLGVIAYRSVVERRQQIGMLRAIGYQRAAVALSFVLESSFIALMGIVSGVVGALILARNLMTSSYFGASGLTFFIPWLEVILFSGVAYGFALLMTWWPSRRAGGVVIAEALRYE